MTTPEVASPLPGHGPTFEAASPLALEVARQRTGSAGSAAPAWWHWATRVSEGGLSATP